MLFTLANATTQHLLPKPHELKLTKQKAFALKRAVQLNDVTKTTILREFLESSGAKISEKAMASVEVKLVPATELGTFDYELAGYDNEGYVLTVETNKIAIKAVSAVGVIRATQTLMQLSQDSRGKLETLEIVDWAAFKLRGYMHDVGRSYIEINELRKEIDLLSRFKVNTFHWHFTENQAWRFEVKSHHELTSASSMTRHAGKYYTQKEIAELAQFAAERGVTIIPELDMPGHSEAFVRATGVQMTSAQGIAILKDALSELVALLPQSPYIHIGADETHSVTPTFIRQMTDYVHGLGRKVVVWNPIAGVKIDAKTLGCDMTQMWGTAGKMVQGVPNIDCRYNYVNHFDTYADVIGIYKSSIYYADRGNKEIAGAIVGIWNDRIVPTDHDIIAQNCFYADVLATAERAWLGGGEKYIEKGGVMLPLEGKEFDEFADWERRFLYHKATTLAGEPIPYVKQTHERWLITDAFPNGGDVDKAFEPETIAKSTYDYNGVTIRTHEVVGAGIYLRHTWHPIVPSLFADPKPNTTAYAWTYVYSPKNQTAGAQIEMQNYSRSERDHAPKQGHWDHKGSRVWINGEEILPPMWTTSPEEVTSETMLTNENLAARGVTKITLKKGWNKVLIKLPYVTLDRKIVRLNKWLFTFAITNEAGTQALPGIKYSTKEP